MPSGATELARSAWLALKARCCTNPTTAVRIVQLNEGEFMGVMVPLLSAAQPPLDAAQH